jgi:hypothetical protein
LEKFRLLRSTLTTKIKNALFAVFEDLLTPINNKAKPEIVLEWKRSEETKTCFKRLFKNISEGSEDTYMSLILNKIWPSGDATHEKVAYAIAVCQTMLDPKQDSLMISESIIKHKLSRNLVCIYYIVKNFYSYN